MAHGNIIIVQEKEKQKTLNADVYISIRLMLFNIALLRLIQFFATPASPLRSVHCTRLKSVMYRGELMLLCFIEI